MKYIVLDMERNQAINYSDMIKDPVFLTGEIIQIGAVKLDESFCAVDTFNARITPRYYTELHPKVAEVTKLSQCDVRKGYKLYAHVLQPSECLRSTSHPYDSAVPAFSRVSII